MACYLGKQHAPAMIMCWRDDVFFREEISHCALADFLLLVILKNLEMKSVHIKELTLG